MELIGKGWEYRVYDIGNGRVRKVKRTPVDSFCRLFFMPKPVKKNRKFRFNPILSYWEMRRISRETDENISRFKKILPFMPDHLVGNPVFLNGVNYEQDYAISLFQYFKQHNVSENRKIITKYAELVVELWKYGCSDNVFNFYNNSGVDKNEQVTMMDFGELAFSKEKVYQAIQSKRWLFQPSYALFRNEELKNYFQTEMERLITMKNLNKYWKLYRK